MDNLTTAMLDSMEPPDVAKLDPETLDALFWLVNEELTAAKRREKRLHDALAERYNARASEAFLADGRDTGTVHVRDGIYDVAVTRPKRVKWDTDKLREVLESLPLDEARHFASVTIKVDERRFAAATPAVQALFAPARTVETGKAAFSFQKKEAA